MRHGAGHEQYSTIRYNITGREGAEDLWTETSMWFGVLSNLASYFYRGNESNTTCHLCRNKWE
jgi:hypothetical protein